MNILSGVGVLAIVLAGSATAGAQTTATGALASTDFTFKLWRVETDGTHTALTTDTLATYFTAARCACPTSLLASLALSDDGLKKLGTSTLDAQLMLGGDCDDVDAATTCSSLGSTLTLSSSKSATDESLSSGDVFASSGCSGNASSTRLWAIVRVDGTRLATQPSLPITLRSAGPVTPTAVTAQTADGGLLVSWTTTGDATTLQGHQVFCSPGPATPTTAAFETCDALPAATSAGPFAGYPAALLCSDLVTVGTNSVRVKGLQNGTLYTLAVAAIGVDGTPSAPSAVVTATPSPTNGFDDVYFGAGGTAAGGCAIAPASPETWAATLILALCLALRPRRPRSRAAARSHRVLALAICLDAASAADAAAATDDDPPLDSGTWLRLDHDPPATRTPSPRRWNLELRLGPYRPDVDSEFVARGSQARPYAQLFTSKRHLLYQIEVDRHLSHRGGTWAIGFNAGYMHVSAAALAADLTTRTGDQTSLTLVPLSASLVYRADFLRSPTDVGLVPYAKAGLDCTLWRISDTARDGTTDGKTLGWHGALGVSLDLATFDADAAGAMDRESGVNQTAIFFEVARYSLDGFGSGAVLHVGDTTWLTGLMFEM